MFPPRPTTFQSCSSQLGGKSCCHDRFCTMRPWCSPQFGQDLRHEKSQEQMRMVMKSMESSVMKANRKNPLEMLARLFPKQSLQALKRVLESCQGDPVFAIERILDRYPSEMDFDDVPVATSHSDRPERRPFNMDDDKKTGDRRMNGTNDDHLSKLAMAYDIPLSLGKLHRDELKVNDSKWEPKGAQSNANDYNENCERSEY